MIVTVVTCATHRDEQVTPDHAAGIRCDTGDPHVVLGFDRRHSEIATNTITEALAARVGRCHHDATCGSTFSTRRARATTREKTGPATSPPPILSPCGSSITTMTTTRGSSAGARPAKNATCL